MGIETNTISVDGTASPQRIALHDGHRRYLALYAKLGACEISIGEGDHAAHTIVIQQGNIFEPTPPIGNAIYYTGVGTTLLIISGVGRPALLAYDSILISYSGIPLTYHSAGDCLYLPPPVFH